MIIDMKTFRQLISYLLFFVAFIVVIYTPVIAEPSSAPVSLRNDIQIRKVIDTGGGCVRLTVDPVTEKLYYMDGKANIYRVDVRRKNRSTKTLVYTFQDIGGAQETSGMVFAPDGTLYVVGNKTIDNTTQAIIRKGVINKSGQRTWYTLASTAPYPKSNTAFDHVVNGIVVSPDERYIYINSGSRTDHGEIQSNEGAFPGVREVPLTTKILRVPTDANDVVLPNDEAQLEKDEYVFAYGVRNSYDLAFAPNGDLMAADNGPDADYTEELNWLRKGHHYGFPWKLGIDDNPQQFPNYDPGKDKRLQPGFHAVKNGSFVNDPSFPPPPSMVLTAPIPNFGPDADEYVKSDGNLQDKSNLGKPIYSLSPHRTPVGLIFDTKRVFPKKYRGDGFLLSWGAANENRKVKDIGQDLLHLKLTKVKGTYKVKATRIVTQFNRPIDTELLNRKLYVLDWGGDGSIWELTFS
jgi:glucose/arabinose dehydrogenase